MHPRDRRLCGLALVATVVCAAASDAAEVRFDRDVLPILSDNCLACHGPGRQEAGLRLDSAAEATRELDSGSRAIVGGDVGASEMIARVNATDPDLVMPPPHSRKVLTADQKALLARWIAAGGGFEQHWSFRPIERPAPPGVPTEHPLDRFLEHRLADEGLPVNGEADRPTLARRLSFALTGLPPTPQEVAAFAADASTDAYERLVDRLLQSRHHGEEMARHWLDAARYADTHGLHLDNEREMWAYRDWVVDAFNTNLPFDRFTIDQLAGDLLPNSTREQQTATGFSRCNVTTSEGGSIDAELVFRYAVDRTATMTNAWMGLTGQCAVCHDHKFDPLSAKEFYSLYAFFNSAADPGFDGNLLRTAPTIRLPTADQQSRLAAFEAAVEQADARLDGVVEAVVAADAGGRVTETSLLDDDFPEGSIVRGTAEPAWFTSRIAGEVFAGERSLDQQTSGFADLVAVGMPATVVPEAATLVAQIWIDPASPPRAVMVQLRSGDWQHSAVWGDWTSLQREGSRTDVPSFLHQGPLPEAGRWTRLAVEAGRLGLKPGTEITGFALTHVDGHVRWDRIGLERPAGRDDDPRRSLEAWWTARTGREPRELADVPQRLHTLVRAGPKKTTKPADREQVRRHWLTNVWADRPAELVRAAAEAEAARKIRDDFTGTIPRTLVFNDLPAMRDSFVMQRGAYDKPGEKVARGTPAFLPPLDVAGGTVPSRLDLARWLVSPRHPLTARVAANRLWQQFFGTGLVKTSEDFGRQGEPPSHPELLDWLAAEYRESGWNTRHLVRLIVTSRAFRRSAAVDPAQLARDPENRLLARGPRIRLDAEQIRDQALAVSGLLVRTFGGRGVRPYQPEGIWEPVGYVDSNTRFYVRDTGPALYRRSLYTFIKRTAPPPFMANFDAPSREAFCARRDRSNTPLQALQLMNDTQHVEAARNLAARALSEAGTADDGRIDWLFRTVLARPAEPAEARIITESLAAHRARYAADPAAAARAVAHGESPPPTHLPAAELAAWTLVANTMLNLDEALTRN